MVLICGYCVYYVFRVCSRFGCLLVDLVVLGGLRFWFWGCYSVDFVVVGYLVASCCGFASILWVLCDFVVCVLCVLWVF